MYQVIYKNICTYNSFPQVDGFHISKPFKANLKNSETKIENDNSKVKKYIPQYFYVKYYLIFF